MSCTEHRSPSTEEPRQARAGGSVHRGAMATSPYADVRAAIADGGSDARVEVNQRALIDKVSTNMLHAPCTHFAMLSCTLPNAIQCAISLDPRPLRLRRGGVPRAPPE